MILIAAAVGVISMFLPWVSVFGFSVNGLHGWGILVFLCFLAAGIIAFMGDQTTNLSKTNWMVALIAGGIAALIMVLNFLTSLDTLSLLSFGFYGALLASIAVVAFTFMFRSATDSLQSGYDSLRNSFNTRMHTDSGNTTATTGTTTTVSHKPSDEPTRPTV